MGESDSGQDPYAPPEAELEGEGSEVDLYRAFITGTKALVGGSFLAGPSDVERYVKRFHRRDEVEGYDLAGTGRPYSLRLLGWFIVACTSCWCSTLLCGLS